MEIFLGWSMDGLFHLPTYNTNCFTHIGFTIYLYAFNLYALTLYALYDIIIVQGGKSYANQTKGNGKTNPC